MVRIRCAIYADVQADVRITGMKLGAGGGATVFDLETKLGNGMAMDSTKDFTVGSHARTIESSHRTTVDEQVYN